MRLPILPSGKDQRLDPVARQTPASEVTRCNKISRMQASPAGRLGNQIGNGKEHLVFHESDSKWVTKVPRASTLWALHYLFGGVSRVVDEVGDMARRVAGDGDLVRLPTTIILFTHDGYRMKQEYIQEDGSVTNIPKHLEEAGQPFLAARAAVSRDNFLSREGVVYTVDPTLNPYHRLLRATGILTEKRYVRIVSFLMRIRKNR